MNICFSSRGSIIRNIPSYIMNICFSSRSCAICHIPSSIMNISLGKWIVYPSMQNAWVHRYSVRICHQPRVPVGKEKWCTCSSFLGYRGSGRQAKNCEKYQFHAVFCRYHWLLTSTTILLYLYPRPWKADELLVAPPRLVPC